MFGREDLAEHVLQGQEKQHGSGLSADGTDPGKDVYIQFPKEFGAADDELDQGAEEFGEVLTQSQSEEQFRGEVAFSVTSDNLEHLGDVRSTLITVACLH